MNLNRRNFLLSGAAVALAPATGRATAATVPMRVQRNVALEGPLAASDSPLLKLVKFSAHEIAVGAKEPFKAIHCSDSHLNFMDVADLLGAKVKDDLSMYEGRRRQMNSLAQLAACVLKARLGGMPLLHTGDFWDYHSVANYQQAQAAFDAAGEAFYAIGNHEIRGHWTSAPGLDNEVVRSEFAPYLPNDSRYAARVLHGVNFISFDDTSTGRKLIKEQFEFLKREFARGLPVVLMVHLPLSQDELNNDIVTGGGAFAAKYAEKRKKRASFKPPQKKDLPYLVYGLTREEAKVREWLLSQLNLKAVLCGHLHVEAQYRLTESVTEYIAGAVMLGKASEISFV